MLLCVFQRRAPSSCWAGGIVDTYLCCRQRRFQHSNWSINVKASITEIRVHQSSCPTLLLASTARSAPVPILIAAAYRAAEGAPEAALRRRQARTQTTNAGVIVYLLLSCTASARYMMRHTGRHHTHRKPCTWCGQPPLSTQHISLCMWVPTSDANM